MKWSQIPSFVCCYFYAMFLVFFWRVSQSPQIWIYTERNRDRDTQTETHTEREGESLAAVLSFSTMSVNYYVTSRQRQQYSHAFSVCGSLFSSLSHHILRNIPSCVLWVNLAWTLWITNAICRCVCLCVGYRMSANENMDGVRAYAAFVR